MDEILARDQNQFREPHRRWLRHSYQEGPGFRFLATRGGRPPGARSPQRPGRCPNAGRAPVGHARGGPGRRTGAALVQPAQPVPLAGRVRPGRAPGVGEARGPRAPTLTHPAWLEQVVIAVRLHTYWNGKRISADL